jgi:hypothetical protein
LGGVHSGLKCRIPDRYLSCRRVNELKELGVLIPRHQHRPSFEEIERQSDGKDCELSNQEYFPTPFRRGPSVASPHDRRIDVLIPPDDRTRTACKEFLRRISDENHPAGDEDPEKDSAEEVERWF